MVEGADECYDYDGCEEELYRRVSCLFFIVFVSIRAHGCIVHTVEEKINQSSLEKGRRKNTRE